ncbi:carboxymuconolactone decarboxylase family protein [Actinospongicola halichondriae]|uniref:carboxymuconolactone decarboxylase family protein n=1 Tax=Actinospongicola halichondriae TaxID=3236844 RepID=UPI003D579C28
MSHRPRPSAPRLEPLDPSSLDDETKGIVPPGSFNIFRTLAHHPKLLKRWMVFGNHVLAKSTLPEREREIVILRIGWRCGAEYEFGQHTVIGERVGLTAEEIRALTGDVSAHDWSDADRALVVAADELHDDQCISDETWSALRETWNTEQLLDIVFTAGQYTLVSMALNSLGVELDEGLPGFPA